MSRDRSGLIGVKAVHENGLRRQDVGEVTIAEEAKRGEGRGFTLT